MDESLSAAPEAAAEQAAAAAELHSTPRTSQRLTVITLLCGASALIQLGAIPFAVIFPDQAAPPVVFLVVVHSGLLAVALVGAWLARREHLFAAVSCLLGSILALVFVGQFGGMLNGAAPTTNSLYDVVYPLVIVLAGITANRRYVLVTASIVAGLSFIVTTALPDAVRMPTLFSLWLFELGTTALIIVFVAAYLATEQDLVEARQAYERMKQIDNLKEQFITSVNHELRNPIMAMLGYLDLLRIQRNRASLERLDLIVSEANQAGQDLRALLNSILETRRLDQGIENFTPQAVNVRDAIAVAVRLIDPREANMHDRELRIRVATHFQIWGDPVHLQQIFTNLISNAVKYSPADAPVEVTAAHVVELYEVAGRWGRTETQGRKMVEILVRDYGLGIPPAQAPLLFQRFARLPRDLASKVVGNGLGLYLCRALAEVMGGKIWVESDGVPGKGSTFFVRLPVPYEEPVPPSPIETSRAEIRL